MEKKKLVNLLSEDKHLTFISRKDFFLKKLFLHKDYCVYMAVFYARKFAFFKTRKGFFFLKFFYYRRRNYFFRLTRLEINNPLTLGAGCKFLHGGTVINSKAVIGNNCIFRGNNCVGSKNEGAPIIGNNVDFGFGSVVIGKIIIADNVIIGANSIVLHSILKKGIVVAGNPAKIIIKHGK